MDPQEIPISEIVSVKIHYGGVFKLDTLTYNGGSSLTIHNVKFHNLNYKAFLGVIDDILDLFYTDIYYCVPGKDIRNGLRNLKSNKDLSKMVQCGLKHKVTVNVLLDHNEADLTMVLDGNESDVEERISNEEGDGNKNSDNVEVVNSNEEGDGNNVEEAIPTEPLIHVDDVDEFNYVDEDEELLDGEYPMHNPNIHWREMKPIRGEIFEDVEQFKNCIINYSVANGLKLFYEESKSDKVLVKCGIRHARQRGIHEPNPCPFRLWASKMGDKVTFQIKSLKPQHNCIRDYNLGSIVSSKWIAKQFADRIIENPKIKLRQLKEAVMKKYKVHVTENQCKRAKSRAIYDYLQSQTTHYEKIWDYGAAIVQSNPGSTVDINVQTFPDGKQVFKRFYVCFHSLKEGWLAGCRKVIGLDGCFLKGIAVGQLLTAVGRDANNQVYPIAWGVVDVETTANWSWFVNLLKNDLGLNNGDDVAIISDQHKVNTFLYFLLIYYLHVLIFNSIIGSFRSY